MSCTCVKCDFCSSSPLAKHFNKMDTIKNTIIEILDIYSSDLSHEIKYDLIFSTWKEAGGWEWELANYYDPDTSYQEDYTSLVNSITDTDNYYSLFSEEEQSKYPKVNWA